MRVSHHDFSVKRQFQELTSANAQRSGKISNLKKDFEGFEIRITAIEDSLLGQRDSWGSRKDGVQAELDEFQESFLKFRKELLGDYHYVTGFSGGALQEMQKDINSISWKLR